MVEMKIDPDVDLVRDLMRKTADDLIGPMQMTVSVLSRIDDRVAFLANFAGIVLSWAAAEVAMDPRAKGVPLEEIGEPVLRLAAAGLKHYLVTTRVRR